MRIPRISGTGFLLLLENEIAMMSLWKIENPRNPERGNGVGFLSLNANGARKAGRETENNGRVIVSGQWIRNLNSDRERRIYPCSFRRITGVMRFRVWICKGYVGLWGKVAVRFLFLQVATVFGLLPIICFGRRFLARFENWRFLISATFLFLLIFYFLFLSAMSLCSIFSVPFKREDKEAGGSPPYHTSCSHHILSSHLLTSDGPAIYSPSGL